MSKEIQTNPDTKTLEILLEKSPNTFKINGAIKKRATFYQGTRVERSLLIEIRKKLSMQLQLNQISP